MGNERVEVAGIAIAPAPPVAPEGSSEHPGAPEGDVSPSGGVTLQRQRQGNKDDVRNDAGTKTFGCHSRVIHCQGHQQSTS